MKKIYLFAATALLFAACSNESDFKQEAKTVEAPQAVMFDTYVPNATRAGWQGVMTTDALQDDGKADGFGVFAQYSNNGSYLATTGLNFMYNEHVYYDASAWTYSPLKYWPNETAKDMHSDATAATSASTDKLSFFAYAPYVESATVAAEAAKGRLKDLTYSADPTKNDAKTDEVGIQAVIANTTGVSDDPWVRYKVETTTPKNSVDLLWGVAPAGGMNYQSVFGAGPGNDVTVSQGLPLLNLIKPSKDQKIKFLFKHALARIGMSVVAAVDQIAPGGELSATTKIAVKSVQIQEVTTTNLATTGTLYLNNATADLARWDHTEGTFNATVSAGGAMNPAIAWTTSDATTYTTASIEGVDKTERKVIVDGSDNEWYWMVIPKAKANTTFKVTIDYVVITEDDKVSGGYSVVENVINKEVTINNFTNNKAYNLKLILGMTSVKLDAEVADWEIVSSTPVDLPRNQE